MQQRKWRFKIGKIWILKSNCTITIKIYVHNIYIADKIVYKSGAEIHQAVFEKLWFEKISLKNFNLKYLQNSWTNHFSQRTRPRTIQNLPPQGILKRLRQFYSRNRWTYKTHFFSFFRFYVFVNNEITVIARKVIFVRKYRYFNSLSNEIHPIQIQ